MRIVTFASGSTGNCSLITDGETNILIDAGISMRRIVSSLFELGLTPQDLCGVLITHEHSDHISGLSMLKKYHNIKIFAPEKLCRVLADTKPDLKDALCYIPEGEPFCMGSLTVRSFRTPHDALYSVGYRLEGTATIGYATDTGCISDELVDGLAGADLALIEANHDIDMLRYGRYPYSLKRRVMSDIGHLSNSDSAILANLLAKSGTRYIILAHLSRENNTPAIAMQTVNTLLKSTETKLFVAPMDKMLAVSLGESVKCLM